LAMEFRRRKLRQAITAS